MSVSTYTSPVNELLEIGEPKSVNPETWPDYTELGIGPEHIPELIRMASDRELRDIEGEVYEDDDPDYWGPLHAIYALGQLHAEEAIEPLVDLLPELFDDEWMLEELPKVFGMLGPAAIPNLEAYLADTSREMYSRSYASNGLIEIAEMHPESREKCIAIISKQLEKYEENDYELNSFLITDLMQLKAVETLPLIEQAFKADRVDEFIVGLDDVLVEFGLKEREKFPDTINLDEFFKHFEKPAPAISPDSFEIVTDDSLEDISQKQTTHPPTYRATGNVIKFSGKRVTKKKGKNKR